MTLSVSPARQWSGSAGRLKRDMPRDFERIISENSRKIYGSVYGMLGNAQEAEDVTQETFYQAYKSYGSFKGDSSASTWLYSIMMNVVNSHLRNKRRQPRQSGVSVEDGEAAAAPHNATANVESSFFKNETFREINAALMKLPLSHRAVFILCVVEEKTSQEAAKIIGISSGTVRVRLYRTMKILRSLLKAGATAEVNGDGAMQI